MAARSPLLCTLACVFTLSRNAQLGKTTLMKFFRVFAHHVDETWDVMHLRCESREDAEREWVAELRKAGRLATHDHAISEELSAADYAKSVATPVQDVLRDFEGRLNRAIEKIEAHATNTRPPQ